MDRCKLRVFDNNGIEFCFESEETPEEVEPVDQAPVPQEEGTPVAPADASMASTQDMSPSATPKKQIQMLPDGTLNVEFEMIAA